MSFPGVIPPPPGVEADIENPEDVLRTINYVTQGLTLFFSSIFVALRFYTKVKIYRGSWTTDDYSTLIAYVLMLGYCITGIIASMKGGGLNLWDVRPENSEGFFKCGYAATIFYAPMTMFVKIALLVIIARVFGIAHYKTRMFIYGLLGLIVGYYVSGVIVKICICDPISAYWKGDTSKCLNQSAIITTDAIVSVISDLAILCLPMPLTWSLQMPAKKKLRITGILCAGGTATAFSIYRLGMIVHEGHSPNQSIVFVKVILTGNAEIGIGLICACLPSVSALFVTRSRTNTDYANSRSRDPNSSAAGNGIIVNRSFHLSTEARASKKERDRDGFNLIPDSNELVMYNHSSAQAADSSKKSLSL